MTHFRIKVDKNVVKLVELKNSCLYNFFTVIFRTFLVKTHEIGHFS